MAAATETQSRQELIEHFQGAVADHEDVMAECLSMLRLYGLSPSDLFFKYEAFLLSRPSGLRAKLSNLTLETARELRKELQRDQTAKAVSGAAIVEKTPNGVGIKKAKGNIADLGGFLDGLSTPVRPKKHPAARLSNTSNNANVTTPPRSGLTPQSVGSNGTATPQRPTVASTGSSYRPAVSRMHLDTPMGKSLVPEPSSPVSGPESPGPASPGLSSTAGQPFTLRPNPHSLIETLNPHLPGWTKSNGVPSGSKPRVTLSSTSDPKDWEYRYMFEKISQRSESLDDMIDEFSESIKDAYGLQEFGDPHFVSEEPIYAVGRILAPPTDTAKANTSTLLLESSRFLGGGKRITLRFDISVLKVRGGAPGVKGFGLFPGCLVCLKGKNGGGGVFVVEEALMPPPSALPQTPIEELIHYQHGEKLAGQPVGVMVAAGPYTLEDDLSYEPLEALLDVVLQERPDVLILLGPFVDAQHPMLATGSILKMPSEIFRDEINNRLHRLYEMSPGTVVLLVPSMRDIVSRHLAYPQAALEKEALGLPKKVKVLPNPCTFSINETLISVTSLDTLFHLRKEEVTQKAEEAEPDPELKGGEVKDSMASLVRHVLGQRSFYPIFPPPESVAGEVNLDVTHHGLIRMDGPAPDVLILPSKLRHFSKIVDSTLVVNPAHLSRPHAAGTFAKLVIHPTSRAELNEAMDLNGGLREHAIYDRARSEIWRI